MKKHDILNHFKNGDVVECLIDGEISVFNSETLGIKNGDWYFLNPKTNTSIVIESNGKLARIIQHDKTEFSQDEKLIAEAMLAGRKVQEYLWNDLSLLRQGFELNDWQKVFQKRIDKICELDINSKSYKVELRKRILQQACLSILAMKVLDNTLEFPMLEEEVDKTEVYAQLGKEVEAILKQWPNNDRAGQLIRKLFEQ